MPCGSPLRASQRAFSNRGGDPFGRFPIPRQVNGAARVSLIARDGGPSENA